MLGELDGSLYALTRRTPDVLIPMSARQGEVRSLLAFTEPDGAQVHLARLDRDEARAWQVTRYDPGDWRGKEELLRAGVTGGCTRLELDPDLDLRPRHTTDLRLAIDYATSHKRASACL